MTASRVVSNNGLDFSVLHLGLIDYKSSLVIQEQLSQEIYSGKRNSALLFCEHPSVITLGRSSSERHILQPRDTIKQLGVDIYNVNRGGDVTLHLPGQLVVYPVFDLNFLGRDIAKFLDDLEEVVILALNEYGIPGERQEGYRGVWVRGKKIASLGIAIRHWVSTHGLSLNINCKLALFSLIKPCGQSIMMTSMEEESPGTIFNMQDVKGKIIEKFALIFKIKR